MDIWRITPAIRLCSMTKVVGHADVVDLETIQREIVLGGPGLTR